MHDPEKKELAAWQKDRLAIAISALMISILCYLNYQNVLKIGFFCDDWVLLYHLKLGIISDLINGWVYFRPLVIWTAWLDWQLMDDNAAWYHGVNLAWHILASVGVIFLGTILLKDTVGGVAAGLVFALHPIHVEAVAWVSGRFDLMCGAFVIWSMVMYLWSRNTGEKLYGIKSIISLVLFLLACLSKEQAYIFPLTLIIYEFLREKAEDDSQKSFSERISPAIPYLVIAAGIFALRWQMIGGIGGYAPEESLETVKSLAIYRWAIQPFILFFYPANVELMAGAPAMLFWSTYVTPLFFLFPLLYLRGRLRIVLFCVLGVLVNTIPTAHIGVMDNLLHSRFLYVSSIFFCLLIGAGYSQAIRFRYHLLVVLVGILTYFSLSASNYDRIGVWIYAGYVDYNIHESARDLIYWRGPDWEDSIEKLVIIEAPDQINGAWLYKIGLGEMLIYNYGHELNGIDFEIFNEGDLTEADISRLKQEQADGVIIWIYDPAEFKFYELFGNQEPYNRIMNFTSLVNREKTKRIRNRKSL